MATSKTVLYLPFLRLPENPEELLGRLALASGLHAGDMRYKIVGSGVTRLTPALHPEKQKALVDEMRDMGIPAVIVDDKTLKRRLKLPAARRVEITDTDLVFYDRHDNPVFRVDKETDLLLIAADISGKNRKQAFINPDFDPRAATRSAGRSFKAELKKITLGSPAVVFCSVGGEIVEGVLLDHSSFHYRSMGDYMQMSAAGNLRAIINEAMTHAKSCIADHGFSTTTLARIAYDENSSKREVLGSLGRYTNYMLTAAEAGLIGPDGKWAADFTYKPLHDEDAGPEADSSANGMAGEIVENQGTERPKPPPPLQHSGIFARVLSAPHEIIYVLLFLLAPAFASVFIQAGDQAHPVFWETATGILFIIAGLGLFPYGLFVLNYKRMVENTPTSKVRSMAMGMAEVAGQARQYYDLKTTYSGTRCVYFRCRHFRKTRTGAAGRWTWGSRHTGNNAERWILERETYSGRLPFYMEDDTGRVLVRPEGALFHISKSKQEFSGAFGIGTPADMRGSNTRVTEDLIAEGARVYVLGKARPEKTGSTVAEKIRKELGALKKDKKRLLAYDVNGDGRVDLDEWETARRDVENRVYAEMLADGAPKDQAVIGKPAYGMLPFIIADSEEGIIRKLGFRVWIFLGGGMLCVILGVQMLGRPL